MKRERGLGFVLACACCCVALGLVAIGVLSAIIGRAFGTTGKQASAGVIYNIRTMGAQFARDMYGTYAHAQVYSERVAFAPTDYGMVATAYEESPLWMRIPCGKWRAVGVASSPYAVQYNNLFYTLYDGGAEVLNPENGEVQSLSMAEVPAELRALTTGQVYGGGELPAGMRHLADVGEQVAGAKVLLQMDDYACSNTFIGGIAAAAFFAIIAGGAWVYDWRRRKE